MGPARFERAAHLSRPTRPGLVSRGTVFSFCRAFRHGRFPSYGALSFSRTLDMVRLCGAAWLCGGVVLCRVIWLRSVIWWCAFLVRRRTRNGPRSRKA
jgi:hypothetical protein